MNLIITHWLHKGLELASGNECFAVERFQLFGIKNEIGYIGFTLFFFRLYPDTQ